MSDDGARLLVTLTVDDFRAMLREAAKEGAREALSSLPSSRLSKTQVAHELRRSVSTIDRYIADGMPCDDAGTRKAFDVETCRAWLRNRCALRTNILSQGIVRKTKAA